MKNAMLLDNKPTQLLRTLGFALFVAFASSPAVFAEESESSFDDSWGDDEWAEETTSPWTASGFTEAAYGRFLQDNVVDSSMSLAEIRARLNLNYSHEKFELSASGDLLYDHVLSSTVWQTRELNIAASPFSALDVKVGRQVLTWGTGDYLFLNDMFAKDWQSFFSGRDDEYLKAPSNSARATTYISDVTFDFVWTPKFTPDNYLTGERFSFYSPAHGQNIAPGKNFVVDQTTNDQLSTRIATNLNGVEYALYGYVGNWTTPGGMRENGVPYFPKLNVWGASALTPFADGIFNVEVSYYDSSEDKNGSNPAIANSQFKALLGYEREMVKNLTASMQYYLEQTLDYKNFQTSHPFPNEIVDEYRHILTLRLRYSAMQQNLIFNFFTFYSPSDKDSYIKPSVNYRYNDNLSFAVGANLFYGKKAHTFFGQHEENTNAWLRAKVQF